MVDYSIFYQNKFNRPFPVPMLAFEVLGVEFAKLENPTKEELLDLYSKVLVEQCGVEFSEEALEIFALRVEKAMPDQASEGNGSGTKRSKKGFASSFYKYLGGLSTDLLLLNICGFDLDKATKLYCEVDRDDVLALAEAYVDRVKQDQSVMLESCVYGFGGSVSGGDADVVEYDLKNDPEAAKAAMKGFF